MKFTTSRSSEQNKVSPTEIHTEENSTEIKSPGISSGNGKASSDIGLPPKKTGKFTMTMLNYTKQVESSENLSKLYNPNVDYESGASIINVACWIFGPLFVLVGLLLFAAEEYIIAIISLALGVFCILMALTKIKRE